MAKKKVFIDAGRGQQRPVVRQCCWSYMA